MATNRILDISQIPEGWLRIYVWAAAAVCATAVLTHLATYGSPATADTVTAITLALLPLSFPIFGVAVVITAFGRVNVGRLMQTMPTALKVIGLLAVAYVFIDFFRMIQFLPGDPTQQGGGYYLNDHGSLLPISFQTYRQSLMYRARMFSGHEVIFTGAATLIGYQLSRLRRGELQAPATPSTRAGYLLPSPFTRQLTVSMVISPEEAIRRLRQHVVEGSGGWFIQRAMLSGSVSDSGFHLELSGPPGRQFVYALGTFRSGQPATLELTATFKSWPMAALLATALILAFMGIVMDTVGHTQFLLVAIPFMVLFGVGGNLAYGFVQRRQLVRELGRILEVRT